jgi:hypothetical protein
MTGPVVVDSAGAMYRQFGALLQTYTVLGGWVTILSNNPDEIYAGGDKIFYRKSGSLFRRDGASWTNLGSAGTQVVIDDLGQAYRIVSGAVSVVRPGSGLRALSGRQLAIRYRLVLRLGGRWPPRRREPKRQLVRIHASRNRHGVLIWSAQVPSPDPARHPGAATRVYP